MIKGQMTIHDVLHKPPAPPPKPTAEEVAAERIRKALNDADAGSYGKSGSAWASYIARADVEVLVRFAEAHGGA